MDAGVLVRVPRSWLKTLNRMPPRELAKGTFIPQCRDGHWDRVMKTVFPDYAEELEAERYIIDFGRRYYA